MIYYLQEHRFCYKSVFSTYQFGHI